MEELKNKIIELELINKEWKEHIEIYQKYIKNNTNKEEIEKLYKEVEHSYYKVKKTEVEIYELKYPERLEHKI